MDCQFQSFTKIGPGIISVPAEMPLPQGARSYVYARKQARSGKDEWLLALVARSGAGKAAVALANKNVRTAWAILTQGTEYNCKPRQANAA